MQQPQHSAAATGLLPSKTIKDHKTRSVIVSLRFRSPRAEWADIIHTSSARALAAESCSRASHYELSSSVELGS